MKHFLAAAACGPFLIACASAGAQQAGVAQAEDARESRVLIINGERIELDGEGDARAAIRQALDNGDGEHRIVLHLDEDGQHAFWSEDEVANFADAMSGMAIFFADGFAEEFDFDFDFDGDMMWSGDSFDSDELRIRVERLGEHAERAAREAERHAERAARMAERHAERAAEHAERLERRIVIETRTAERMAARAERMGERMAVQGLRAGVRGLEQGIAGIDRVLERGWYEQDGERVELDAEKRAELEETRAELAENRVELREELESLRARLGQDGERREVRIERRDGSVRGWVNGEEVTGSELDALLEGAPEAPDAPDAP
jgi:hypothetical protein